MKYEFISLTFMKKMTKTINKFNGNYRSCTTQSDYQWSAFLLGAFFNLHSRTDYAKIRELTVWSRSFLSGDTLTNITAFASDYKYLCKIIVNLQFLNVGLSLSLMALITFPNSVSELLIDLASYNLRPMTPESFCL